MDQEDEPDSDDANSWTAPKLQFAPDFISASSDDECVEDALERVMDTYRFEDLQVVTHGTDTEHR